LDSCPSQRGGARTRKFYAERLTHLLEFAEEKLQHSASFEDSSVGEHLEYIKKQKEERGEYIEEDDDSPPSPEWFHLYEYFLELNSGRQYGMGFPQPISFHEILSWCIIKRMHLWRHEVDAIKGIDNIFMKIQSDAAKQESKRRKKKK
jgi:hypothetical protein